MKGGQSRDANGGCLRHAVPLLWPVVPQLTSRGTQVTTEFSGIGSRAMSQLHKVLQQSLDRAVGSAGARV